MALQRDPDPPVGPSLAAGALSGMVGVASFYIFHSIWIFNTPAVLVDGPIIAGLAGLAVGWAFHHLHVHGGFPADHRGALLLAATLWLLLIPYEVVGVLFGPFSHLTRPIEMAMFAPVGFLATPLAAVLGWALTHRVRSTVALTVAVTLLHFMIGGSLVFFGGRGILFILFVWMLPTYIAAGFVLVGARAALLRRARPERSELPERSERSELPERPERPAATQPTANPSDVRP